MANNNTPVEKKSFFSKLASLPRRTAKGISNMWHELKKVSWPTRKQLFNYTMVVLVFMLFYGRGYRSFRYLSNAVGSYYFIIDRDCSFTAIP